MVKKTSDIIGDGASSAKPELLTILYYAFVILIIGSVLYLLGVI